ncbi:MAG: OmpA family protein [Candidatus Methanoperedens sp.]|nr:OmpA family protein [Candidatus Methanoperedens sp.]
MNIVNDESGRATLLAKLLIAVAVCGGAFFGLRKGVELGVIPAPGFVKSLVPSQIQLPELKDAQVANVAPAPFPGEAPANVASTLIRGEIWEWNAQMGLLYANGGAQTTRGSLMEKRKVNLQLTRQDDTNKMQEDLITCAKEIHDGAKQCSTGANFVIIMGDGSAQFAAAANPQLKKINDSLVVIGAVGYSRGEDAFMAPPKVRNNPQNAKGLLVAGVLRDGDWNIALKWAGDNNIKNNPDEKTYDPEAINWVNAPDYNKAAEMYVAGQCEDRKVVKDGRPTTEVKHVCVDSVVTWTPGDVTAVKNKGGLIKVVSSKEYRSQMPSVIIGSRAFFNANREEVVNLLAATFEGGDQVRAYDKALYKAAEISAKVYADQDAAYWYKYFKGVTETDREGNQVFLGGSAVNGLEDNIILFGLRPGVNDNFRSTYTLFGSIVMQQYGELFKDTPLPEIREIEDKSFVIAAQSVADSAGAAADTPTFQVSSTSTVVSSRSYSITFDTGKATLTQEGIRQLLFLKDNLAITGLNIKIDGHTDNTGDEQRTNLPLSVARAEAVKTFLQAAAPGNFPSSRFQVTGHGSMQPLSSNATASGRAANRRVQITLVK